MNLTKAEVLPHIIFKKIYILFEQTKTNPQETLEFKLTKSRDTLSINPTLGSEEENFLTAVAFSGVDNRNFDRTEQIKILKVHATDCWQQTDTFKKLE